MTLLLCPAFDLTLKAERLRVDLANLWFVKVLRQGREGFLLRLHLRLRLIRLLLLLLLLAGGGCVVKVCRR